MNKALSILLCVMLGSCIEPYYLNPDSKFKPKLVVDALINNYDSVQKIVLSKSTSPEVSALEPLSDCIVNITDDNGNQFDFMETDTSPGDYRCVIDKVFFGIGTNYTLHILTPEGSEYISETEKLIACPPVDSVKFRLERKPTIDEGVTEDGLQFFIDLKADDYNGRYYRWTIDETWEYHSEWPIFRYMDETGYHEGPTDYSKFTCYKSSQVSHIFVLSTQEYASNRYLNYKLQFVNDHTQKLMYRYSILVKQYSISNSVYNFWESLVKNNQESGGLYETQPSRVQGNIYNVSDTSDRVLGIFSISAVASKRIDIPGSPSGLSFKEVPHCKGSILFGAYDPAGNLPAYFVYETLPDGTRMNALAQPQCVDCTLLGGSTEPPSFWKEK